MANFQPIACSFATPKSERGNNTAIRESQICLRDVSDIPFVYNPRFAELLETNDTPETADLLFLNTSLDNARSISARLSEGILALQCVPKDLVIANSAVLMSIAQHRAILNPLRSIPDDILFTIFQWCSSSDTRGLDSLSSSRAPWTLSHVSRRWRTLAMSTPCLWSNIEITSRDPDTSIPYARDLMSFKLNLYLRRSAECDLFVNISARNSAFFDECFPLLLSTANRWKCLTFAVYDPTAPSRIAECSFERLTKLTVFFWNDAPAGPGDHYTWKMPNIRDLFFSGSILDTVELPWERVASYTCDENGLCHLPKLSALQHLSLAVSTFNVALQILGVYFPLTLPTVRSVSMWQYYSDTEDIEKISAYMVLPSLTTLTINMGHQNWKFPRFNGSIRHLQNLSIISLNLFHSLDVAFPSDKLALRSFLAKCTSVTALYLDVEVAEEVIFHALADESALPKLTSLRVAVKSMWKHPDLVLKLVELRCQGVNVAPLTELRIVEVENAWKGRWTPADMFTEGILDRWYAICSKVNVVTVFENDFRKDNRSSTCADIDRAVMATSNTADFKEADADCC